MYPIFLSLEGMHCLVVGLGAVGLRKVSGLLAAGAEHILALDVRPLASMPPASGDILAHPAVSFAQRPWDVADILKSFLVFACTSQAEENSRIAALCREHRILCNSATDPVQGSFIVPAVARTHQLSVALSTGGQSPLLAARWRGDLEEWLRPRGAMAWFLGRIRPHILALGLSQQQNRALFSRLGDGALEERLAAGEREALAVWLKERLPEELHPVLHQILAELPNVLR